MFAFYFSEEKAALPCDTIKRKYPTRIGFIPAHNLVISFTTSVHYTVGNPTPPPNAGELLLSGVEDTGFILLRDNTRVSSPELWRKFTESHAEAFTSGLAKHGLTTDALLEEWNSLKAVRKRALGNTAQFKPPDGVYYSPTIRRKFNPTW